MRATEFEFRTRFIFIMGFYVLGFLCYAWDHVTVAVMLTEWLRRRPMQSAQDRHLLQVILGLGTALALVAALLRTWAAAYLRSEVVHDFDLHGEKLVADGPFRYVRNPLYLGGILFSVGFALAASRLGYVVIVGGLTLFFFRLIAREEALLAATQGETYRQYLKVVPRMIPSLRPRVAAGGTAPRWAQAVTGETFMWLFAVALACFAATLNSKLLQVLVIAGASASVLAKIALRRGKRAPAR